MDTRFSSYQMSIKLLLLIVFVGLSRSSNTGPGWPERNNKDTNSCLEVLSECRKNSTCKSAYKTVKKTCKRKGNMCHNYASLIKCADNIDFLKANMFGEACHCSMSFNKLKRIYACSTVHNLLFANPCYDHGVTEREEQKRLSMTTTWPERTSRVSDVTRAAVTKSLSVEHNRNNSIESDSEPQDGVLSYGSRSEIFRRYNEKENKFSVYRKKEPTNKTVEENIKPKLMKSPKNIDLNQSIDDNDEDQVDHRHKNEDKLNGNDASLSLNEESPPPYNVIHQLRDDNADKDDDGDLRDDDVKVIAKLIKDKNELINSEEKNNLNKSQTFLNGVIVLAESKQKMKSEEVNENRAINLTTIILAVGCVFSVFVIFVARWCYKKFQRKNEENNEKKQKHPHSAIIVTSLYDERDLKLNKKPNFV